MGVIAPPEPPHDDLEAVIEEARRRARRRRLRYATAAAAAVVIGGSVYAGLTLTGGAGKANGDVPAGFRLVKARGPVRHALIEGIRPQATSIDLATGRERPTRTTTEVWWDRRSGLVRAQIRTDGLVQLDAVGQTCQRSPRFCFWPPPFDLQQQRLGWPLDPRFARRVGPGSFRGRPVIWIESRRGGEQVALNAITHEPVATRTIAPGRAFDQQAITMLPDLRADGFSFAVPESGPVPAGLYPPIPETATVMKRSSLDEARSTLGKVPLWLGPKFRGHRLRLVQAGKTGIASNGKILRPATFVRLDYGFVRIDEFGVDRPFKSEGMRPGHGVLFGAMFRFGRDGLLVAVQRGDLADGSPAPALGKAEALEIAKALAPVGFA